MFISPLMMGAGAALVTPIAFGVLDASNPTLDPAALGAQVGDLVVINNVYDNPDVGSSLGGGWTETTYDWFNNLYTARFSRRTLASLADITVPFLGNAAPYGIWRGPTSATIVYNAEITSGTSHAVAFPSKDAACVALAVFGQTVGPYTNLNPPADWSDRVHGYTGSYAVDLLDNLAPPSGSHTATFTGVNGGSIHRIVGVELRT